MGKAIRALVLAFASCGASAQTAAPLDELRQAAPALYTLYEAYPSLHEVFSRYAAKQGFTAPVESLATIVHETIHVASAAHEGFFVDGVYYEPYLRTGAWPALNNRQVAPYLLDQERVGPIFRLYASNTPRNNLGNLVDEINAYGHVLPFVCRYEPQSGGKQVANLLGFLGLTEAYLRTLRTALPAEYDRFARQREARGAFTLIVQRAWQSLQACGISRASIPAQEARYLMSLPRV